MCFESCNVLWTCFRPAYPTEELEEEAITEDDAELTLNKLEEEIVVGAYVWCPLHPPVIPILTTVSFFFLFWCSLFYFVCCCPLPHTSFILDFPILSAPLYFLLFSF